MRPLDGPRREPKHGSVNSLVVLTHGYGANGEDLIALADAWADSMPGVAFVAPGAPESLPDAGPIARQWFALTFRDPRELWNGVSAAGPTLDRFLDTELQRYGLAPNRLALVGFSQGTMMALHVGLRRSVAPAAIVGFSGLIAGADHLAADIVSRPAVQLIHGELDELIPFEALHMTRESLAAAGVPVEWHMRPGLGHGIDPEGFRLAGSFLRDSLRRGG